MLEIVKHERGRYFKANIFTVGEPVLLTSDVKELQHEELNALIFSCTPDKIELVCEPHDLFATKFKTQRFIGSKVKVHFFPDYLRFGFKLIF